MSYGTRSVSGGGTSTWSASTPSRSRGEPRDRPGRALSHLGGAAEHLEAAVVDPAEPDLGPAGRLHPLEHHRDPLAAVVAAWLPVDGPGGVVEELLEMDVVHGLARAEAVAVDEQVPAAQLDRVDAELGGHQVGDAFRCPHRLGGAVAAERAGRRKVGVDAEGVDGDVVEPVGADAGIAHLHRHPRAAVGIGAGVDPAPDALGHEPAVAGGAQPDPDGGGVAGEGDELLLTVEGQPHRSVEPPRDRSGDGLGAHEGLGAERPAHGRADDAHVGVGQAEQPGQVLAHVERRLGSGGDLEPAVAPAGDAGVGFHRDVLHGRHTEGLVDDHLGGVESLGVVVGLRVGGVRLPLRQARRADPEAVAHVGPLEGPQAEVGGVAVGDGVGVVHQRGAGAEGVTLVEDRG